MEKNRTGQIITIIALIVGVVGLSIGFAAFSSALNIQASANVKPDSNTMNVDFSSSMTAVETNDIIPTTTPEVGIESTAAKIDNTSDPTIKNLSATFTEPGQKAVYEFYAFNTGELKAFLKSIVYENVTSETSNKVCAAVQGGNTATEALVQKACEKISVTVAVGDTVSTTSGIASISDHSLEKKTSEKITVTLEYAADAERVDGDFTVSFGNIILNYSSAN